MRCVYTADDGYNGKRCANEATYIITNLEPNPYYNGYHCDKHTEVFRSANNRHRQDLFLLTPLIVNSNAPIAEPMHCRVNWCRELAVTRTKYSDSRGHYISLCTLHTSLCENLVPITIVAKRLYCTQYKTHTLPKQVCGNEATYSLELHNSNQLKAYVCDEHSAGYRLLIKAGASYELTPLSVG